MKALVSLCLIFTLFFTTVQPATAATLADLQAALEQLQTTLNSYSQPAGQVKAAISVTVNNNSELATALNNATGGETIILQDGNYGSYTVNGMNFSSYVTVQAANKDGAVFNSFRVRNSNNVIVDGIRVNPATVANNWTLMTEIRDSNSVIFRNMSVESGSPTKGYAYQIWGGSDNIIENSSAKNTNYSMSIRSGTKNATIRNNDFSNFSGDAINISPIRGAMDGVLIQDNLIHSGDPLAGAHPDMIQVFNTVSSGSLSGLEITGNVILQPQRYTQSIFFGNFDGTFQDAKVHNNFIYNDHTHGITLGGPQHAEVYNNTLLSTEGNSLPGNGAVRINSFGNDTVYNNVVAVMNWEIVQDKTIDQSTNTVLNFESSSSNYFRNAFTNLPGFGFNVYNIGQNEMSPTSGVPSSHGYQGSNFGIQGSGGTPPPPPPPPPTPTDSDSDGIADSSDNCPNTANASQADYDNDGAGDACDTDDDNDGILDTNETSGCTLDPDPNCGVTPVADTDSDGVADTADNCPLVSNPTQANFDNDSQGDACDTDDDNDGILDTNETSGCQFNNDTQCGIVNSAPVAGNDLYVTDADTVLSGVNVLQNDTDSDNDSLSVNAFTRSGSNGGTFTLQSDGDLTFDPDNDFDSLFTTESQMTSVSYTVSDGSDNDSGSIEVTVSGTQVQNPNPNPNPVDISAKSRSVFNKKKNNRLHKLRLDGKGKNTCGVTTFDSLVEGDLVNDGAYEYELGLYDFTIDCINVGETVTVAIELDQVYDTSEWVFRKYNPNTNDYTTVNNVSYPTVSGVTVIEYEVTDGGPLDHDGLVNGSITDPAGPATIVSDPVPAQDDGDNSSTTNDEEDEDNNTVEADTPSTPATRVRTTDTLNVRGAPGGNVITRVPAGTEGTEIEGTTIYQGLYTWVKVRFDNGVEGFVAQPFITEIDAEADRDRKLRLITILQELVRLLVLLRGRG